MIFNFSCKDVFTIKTHPEPEERIDKMKENIEELKKENIKK